MAAPATGQTNIVVNKARHLIFFEESELCYNYKTQQWTRIPGYDGYAMYSVNDKDTVIGLVVYSAGSVDLQDQLTSGVTQFAKITTAAPNINQGGRAVVTGVRPIVNGAGTGGPFVRVGVQDEPEDTPSYSTQRLPNARSGLASMRSEGRYVRLEIEFTDDFETIVGADVEFSPQGRI